MAHLGFSLELNASGLDLVHRRRPYPAPWMVELAQSLGVPLVYGSDAHRPEDVGRYASQAATWAKGGA
jgi:histidinol-phosphatase (PHP family)